MTRADKAVLRVTCGLGVAALTAYGFALQAPFVVCLMAFVVLCKPGPPMPLAKGALVALAFGGLMTVGVLMVPMLEHYVVTGLLLTAVILFAVFYGGLRRAHPLTTVLLLAFALIPVVGVADQALVGALSLTMGVGLGVGTLVNAFAHAWFPDDPAPAGSRPPPAQRLDQTTASWIALRGVLIVMPVFALALWNPSYLAAIMKTVTLGQQATHTSARSAGQELVGSTLMGALVGVAVWLGLSLWPSLWMLALWLMAATMWCVSAMFRVRKTRWPTSFWANVFITAVILLGPAIEDSANGKSVLEASAVRIALFVGVAVYAWATVWTLERVRAWRAAS